jgi:hypothetical protein
LTAPGRPEPGLALRRARTRLDARRARRRRILRWTARVLVAAVVFLFGVALGRALEEGPRPGGTRTVVRTLEPGTLPPVTRTLTVTTPEP